LPGTDLLVTRTRENVNAETGKEVGAGGEIIESVWKSESPGNRRGGVVFWETQSKRKTCLKVTADTQSKKGVGPIVYRAELEANKSII